MFYKMKLFSAIFFLLTFQVFEKQCNAIANDSIPAKEKIFRTFCTTKPFGEERKLGLSLAYDIVKAHAGVLKVETLPADLSAGNDVKTEAAAPVGNEGRGSTFTILLPI